MTPMKIIGYHAEGIDHQGNRYDCSFTVTYPMDQSIPQHQVDAMCKLAIGQFQNYHPSGKILAKLERVLMMGVDYDKQSNQSEGFHATA